MKSYFIHNIPNSSVEIIENLLDRMFSGQRQPWLVKINGDAAAYLNIENLDHEHRWERTAYIVIDISGRHYNDDQFILSQIKNIIDEIGGLIVDDNDKLVERSIAQQVDTGKADPISGQP